MTAQLEGLTQQATMLIERWQRGLPLKPRPFAVMGETVGLTEVATLDLLRGLIATGVISRVGATLRPNTVGASQLAAMSVPQHRLDEVAATVNRESGVNHNYEREHAYNLWFVITGRAKSDLNSAITRIRRATDLDVLELPLERSYYIDLGFSLTAVASQRQKMRSSQDDYQAVAIDEDDRSIIAALETGIPLVPRPFAEIAEIVRSSEATVIGRLDALVRSGVISRFGVIVRHRSLGMSANAMAVWNIPDGDVDRIGAVLAAEPCVSLCYRRPRRLPDWPYNLFCMVHGRERAVVRTDIAHLNRRAGLRDTPHEVLFSNRCFRQRGPSIRGNNGADADA